MTTLRGRALRPFPATVGGYRLLERVGVDPMSEWFRAEVPTVDERHARGGEGVVLDRAPYRRAAPTPELRLLRRVYRAGAPEQLPAAFVDESLTTMRFYSALSHPNISTVERVELVGGEIWCTSPWLEGCTLRALIERGRAAELAVPLGALLYLGVSVVDALCHVHAQRLPDGQPLGLFLRMLDPPRRVHRARGHGQADRLRPRSLGPYVHGRRPRRARGVGVPLARAGDGRGARRAHRSLLARHAIIASRARERSPPRCARCSASSGTTRRRGSERSPNTAPV